MIKRPEAERSRNSVVDELDNSLRLGLLLSEKCAFAEAVRVYEGALEVARRLKDFARICEAISGLLRLAGEALDESSMRSWERELDQVLASENAECPSLVWFCKGAIARHREQHLLAQRYFHRFLREAKNQSSLEGVARAWAMLGNVSLARGHDRRAELIANEALHRFEAKELRSVNGSLYVLLALVMESRCKYDEAMHWFHKAHVAFLADHNWYYHLYVLKGYARIARRQRNYALAYMHLDLLDKIAAGPEFGVLRRQIALEREALKQDAVDILIDRRRGVIKMRDGAQVSLRKQYVLLNILEALSEAHARSGNDERRSLSKAELVARVWREKYQSQAHDNKLYYNINRIRKLIEPDMRQPKYLQNWKEGYRLAPGLKVQLH